MTFELHPNDIYHYSRKVIGITFNQNVSDRRDNLMTKRILVAYSSRHNATAEIANVIGDALRIANSATVDVQSVESVQDIKSYDAVVLGSAVYMGRWQPAAADFLKRNETELAQRPVWLFSSGPTGAGDPHTLLKGWTFPAQLQAVADRIKPRDTAVFPGRLDPSQLNLFDRSVIGMVKAPIGDFRDWKQIQSWAATIAQAI